MSDTSVKASVELTAPVILAGKYWYTQLGPRTIRVDSSGRSWILRSVNEEFCWVPIKEVREEA